MSIEYHCKQNVYSVTYLIYYFGRFIDELEDYIYDGDDIRFEILFRLNRFPLRLMHRAVDLVVDRGLRNFLFPVSTKPHPQRALPQKNQVFDSTIFSRFHFEHGISKQPHCLKLTYMYISSNANGMC